MATCSVQASVCALCGEPSRYRCPACSIRTCSLACVQLHKYQQSCSGVRETEKFRAVQQFDDAALGRDYRFLEDLDRAVDGSKRALRNDAPPTPPKIKNNGSLTPARQTLVRHASERGVQLEMLPVGMTRQRENSTRYDGRRRSLGWRVELRFVDAGVLHALPCVPEDCTLLQMLRSCLEPNVQLVNTTTTAAGATGAAGAAGAASEQATEAAATDSPDKASRKRPFDATAADAPAPPSPASSASSPPRRDEGQRALLRHRLRAYGKAGAANLRVYMLAECRRANDPRYHELAVGAALGEALRGKAVIEFPTLHVALPAEGADEERFPLLSET